MMMVMMMSTKLAWLLSLVALHNCPEEDDVV